MKSSNSGENKYRRRRVIHPDMRLTAVLPRTEAQETFIPEYTAVKEPQKFERSNISERRIIPRGSYQLAFYGVYTFIFLLYLRPNDLLPLGTFPLIKIITVLVVLTYIFSKASTGESTIITIEAKLMLFIAGLALALAPISASPGDTLNVLNETYSKIVIIFILLTNLLDTRERILKIWVMVSGFGAWLSFLGMRSYFRGEFGTNERIKNSVGGMFGNPNDLAASIDIMLPMAVVMAIMSSKKVSRLFYFGCIAIMLLGLVITQSRGGFLGFIVTVSFLTWKLAKGRRLLVFGMVIVISGSALVALPGSYTSKYIGRIGSIFDFNKDETGAAQERQALFYHNLNNFLRRPITGVGMGNLHIYSLKELGAHNAYLETAAELGIFGFMAYIAFMVYAYRGIHRIEKRIRDSTTKQDKQLFYMCVALKAAFIAYFICSVFASVQYQWFIYLPAAYAVGLRRIDELERQERGDIDNRVTAYGTILKVTTRLNAAIFAKERKPAPLFPSNKLGKGKLIK